MRRVLFTMLSIIGLLAASLAANVDAASSFASPAFQSQWQAGEAITPNFWGPLASATDSRQEPYTRARSHLCPSEQTCPPLATRNQRPVQYFDKGRMELTDDTLTNGLLAKELVTGNIQVGEFAFIHLPPPAIPIAGDLTNTGPTYAMVEQADDTVPRTSGRPAPVVKLMRANGDLVPFARVDDYPEVRASDYDPTSRIVANVFATFRDRVGLAAVGYATTAPFWVNMTVGGQAKDILVQVFERRVLTYTPANPDAFKVEMGNIGQHYYQWRYGAGPLPPLPAVDPMRITLTITFADTGSRVTLAPGERFLLNLGKGYDWTTERADGFVLSREPATVFYGGQGIYVAEHVGASTLTATGYSPPCTTTQPMCGRSSVKFHLDIMVT